MAEDDTTPGSGAATPRWVKVFAVVGVAVLALVAVMLLTGHGPGRHRHAASGTPAVAGALRVARR